MSKKYRLPNSERQLDGAKYFLDQLQANQQNPRAFYHITGALLKTVVSVRWRWNVPFPKTNSALGTENGLKDYRTRIKNSSESWTRPEIRTFIEKGCRFWLDFKWKWEPTTQMTGLQLLCAKERRLFLMSLLKGIQLGFSKPR